MMERIITAVAIAAMTAVVLIVAGVIKFIHKKNNGIMKTNNETNDTKYVVYGVFDNREVTFKSDPMTKEEAEDKLSHCCDSMYTKYYIREVESK